MEAFVVYDSIMKGEKIAPDMLLKMAYVKEGLGDYTMALYYLNLYQLNFPSSLVLKKMDKLGAKYNLRGYEFTDYEYFASIYNKFNYQISYVFLGLSVAFFTYTALRIRKGKSYPRSRLYLVLLVLIFSYGFINFGIPSYKGIVSKDHTFIMDGPSSGAKILAITEKGNRINILNKDDVWFEVLWEDKPAFIKRNHLLTIVNSRNAEQFNLFSIIYNKSKHFYWSAKGFVQALGSSRE
ncbi:MAG TPA: hypothetical protein VL947_09770 [Cytophagales bacterium]|nr:hypothetical protein [Cytophagales bacterium]